MSQSIENIFVSVENDCNFDIGKSNIENISTRFTTFDKVEGERDLMVFILSLKSPEFIDVFQPCQ